MSAEARTLSVIIVTYNSARHLPSLLETIPDTVLGERVEILVVDNASLDATVDIAVRDSRVRLIANSRNVGFSGGINIARLHRKGGALAIINPDARLEPGALDRLVSALGEPRTGIALPQLRSPDGILYKHLRREPTLLSALGDAIFGDHWPSRPQCLSDTLRNETHYGQGQDVAWGGGAVIAISETCDRLVGDWNSRDYFMYSEETDYARRTRAAGLRVRYVPEAVAIHEGGGSGRSSRLNCLLVSNRIRYFGQHHSTFQTELYRCIEILRFAIRSADREHRHVAGFLLRRNAAAILEAEFRSQVAPNSSPGAMATRLDTQRRN